jgi:acyl carrier protein
MYEQIAQILHKERGIPLDKITPEASFSDLGLDSLDVVDLLMVFEDKFGVTMEINAGVKTVGELSNYIATLKK